MRRRPNQFFLTCVLVLATFIALLTAINWEWHPAVAWVVACNVVTFPLWGYDKWQSRRDGLRVPEATLHTLAFLGACPASFMAMVFFRHKISKPLFRWLYVAFLLVHLAATYYWFEVRGA